MEIIKLSDTTNQEEVIGRCIDTLNSGGLVVYPTETCYGMAADPTNQEAVEKLLDYKKKREGKAISVAVSDKKMAKKYVEMNEIAENIYDNYLPGPITVVSKSKGKVVKKVEADDETLGIRVPKYPFILKLIKKFGKPITATSANASYKKTPYTVKNILDNTSKKQQELIKDNRHEVEDFVGNMIYLVLKIAYMCDVDSEKAVRDIMKEYEKRFPKERIKGTHSNTFAGGTDLK